MIEIMIQMKFLAIFAVVGFAAAQSATYDVCHNRCSNDLEKCKKECHIEVLSVILFDSLSKQNFSGLLPTMRPRVQSMLEQVLDCWQHRFTNKPTFK